MTSTPVELMNPTIQSKVALAIPLGELEGAGAGPVGGKAEGLARLIAMGLDVPAAFVIVGAMPGSLPPDLDERCAALGEGPVAVRSSAIGEDGADASFAGQFDTYLDVRGEAAIREAVEKCLASVDSARVDAYRGDRAEEGAGVTMCVVVQRMVDARAAGVCFTVDPVSGRRERLVVDAVAGIGEALVSGEATPDHFEVNLEGEVITRDLIGESPLMSDAELQALAAEAREAARKAGHPLDLEWAIDTSGTLRWLQARPVTHLPADPRALDTVPDPRFVWTKANIGEMMPGAVTPLTLSVSARGIDAGMQRFYRSMGMFPAGREEESVYVASFGNHLFLNLTEMAQMTRQTFGAKPRDVAMAVCGREVPELEVEPPHNPLRRAWGTLRYASTLMNVPKARAELEALVAAYETPRLASARAQWEAIEDAHDALYEVYRLHLHSSSGAGAMAPALLATVSKGDEPTEEHHAEVASLLAGATDVESADIAAGADRVVDAITAREDAAACFVDVDEDEALAWLRSESSEGAGEAFASYLERHGHRAVREAEIRQPEWRHDPMPIVRSLRAGCRARLSGKTAKSGAKGVELATLSTGLRRVVKMAHAAVRSRERTKSLLIAFTAHLKEAYRHLAGILLRQGAIDDEDLVFFLSHAELGELCLEVRPELVAEAEARRRALPIQMSMVFPEVFQGVPEEIEPAIHEPGEVVIMKGKPVSAGVVRGLARVARSLDEAAAVEDGEILITPITDVGWTPYFSVIAGLATDIGSAVSHGAVVAREYGMPAVVNLGDATARFKTGDRVVLDGTKGILRLETDDDESLTSP